MESNHGDRESVSLPEVRLMLIGWRRAGKSSSGNTILRTERFECGRIRTAQAEVRHEEVEGRNLIVVDAPGWSSSLSLTEIPEGDKQRFKLSASKCPPGPNAILLIIPIDSAFSKQQRLTVEEHMKLLGDTAWRYTMVLFTCGDFLQGKTIEQHIESEGEALKWLVEKCKNRYHVINNKDKSNSTQVTLLLQKIDKLMQHNNNGYYEVDEQTLRIIEEKQREVAERAEKRQKRVEEQRQQMKELISEEKKSLPKLQLILLGSRSVGKTSVGNTILGHKDQEDGIRTMHSVARAGYVGTTEVTVVDTPGWWKGFTVVDTPKAIKEELKLSMFLCPPGPHVFLLVIDADASFRERHFDAVTTHLELLGEDVWKRTIAVFTRGDWLGTRKVEEYIESEGKALQSIVEKCGNRYHVMDSKNADDGSQITELLEKISETVAGNGWSHCVPDEQILLKIEERRQKVEEAAKLRQNLVETRKKNFKEEKKSLPKLQLILLGSQSVGKTSVGNTILGHKDQEDGIRTMHSVARAGYVGTTEVTVVDTPGWWKGFTVVDTPEAVKEELKLSMFLCPPGPHVFLLVIDADASFRERHFDAVTTHLELLGEDVWKRTIAVFTRGDWLGTRKVEEYIESEGKALQSIVEKCGNRYHVMDSKNADDGSQVTELLEKISETIAGNGWSHCVPDEQILLKIEERRQQVEEAAKLRQNQVETRRNSFKGSRYKLPELRLFLLGEKTAGKSTSGNILLHKEVFATCENKYCQAEQAKVADRLVTVVDTPGWQKDPSYCTEEMDKEIVHGLTLCPLGVHAVLLVVPLDLTFRDVQKVATEAHVNLLDSSIWNHTLVLFTYGDKLADKSIEEHIEREPHTLRWLVDKCKNRYHVLNNTKKNDTRQIMELYEKVEDMVAGNDGQLFCPDMSTVHQRIHEKFRRKKAKHVLIQQLNQEYRRRELELMRGFKETLLSLQSEVKRSSSDIKHKAIADVTKIKTRGFGQSKKDGQDREDGIDMKFEQEIEKMDKGILQSTDLLRRSKRLMPNFKRDEPEQLFSDFDGVLDWLSTLEFDTNFDNQMTLNSQTSGYRSLAEDDIFTISGAT